jgi:NitT/TauT family transport system substrate-binding protein
MIGRRYDNWIVGALDYWMNGLESIQMKLNKFTTALTAASLTALFCLVGVTNSTVFAQNAKPKFTLIWSIYVGWMPWPYGAEAGIIKKWGDKYGIEIDVRQADYIASIEAYVAGKAEACVMTNMECLDMPAASGIDNTVVIVGDFSNGNDALYTRDNLQIPQLRGNEIALVELSVSHYLLVRALELKGDGLQEKDIKILNTSDADIAPVFISNPSQKAVVTWNPMALEIEQTPGVKREFDSSAIPGEILDLLVIRTEVLKKTPQLGKALAGAWFEMMAAMSGRTPAAEKIIARMAELSGATPASFKQQLKTTAMYYRPQDAVTFMKSPELQRTMDFVRKFCFDHKLLGESAKSADEVGIQFPDGKILGDPNNVKMRFTTEYVQIAAEGKL